MRPIALLLCGLSVGVGLLFVVSNLRQLPTPSIVRPIRRATNASTTQTLWLVGVGVGILGFVVTGWIAVAFACLLGLRYLPSTLVHQKNRRTVEAKTVALATWLEQLRDTVAVSSGLEQALVATSAVGPEAIAPELQRLSARLAYQDPVMSLRLFADELDTSLGDFLVSALTMAIRHQARDLSGLLTQLAESAHEQHRASVRVWVGRARTRSSVRIIVSAVVIFVLGLLVLNYQYLQPYSTGEGQVVLVGVVCIFAFAFIQLQRLADSDHEHRFVSSTTQVSS